MGVIYGLDLFTATIKSPVTHILRSDLWNQDA